MAGKGCEKKGQNNENFCTKTDFLEHPFQDKIHISLLQKIIIEGPLDVLIITINTSRVS